MSPGQNKLDLKAADKDKQPRQQTGRQEQLKHQNKGSGRREGAIDNLDEDRDNRSEGKIWNLDQQQDDGGGQGG